MRARRFQAHKELAKHGGVEAADEQGGIIDD